MFQCFNDVRNVRSAIYNSEGRALRYGQIVDVLNRLSEIKQYAEGHHADQESSVLHSLTVDIPHQIDLIIDELEGK